MDRFARVVEHLDLAGRGLELGPAYDPLIRKSDGFAVETVDHASRHELVEKYTSWGLSQEVVDRIEDVDHLWSGGSLTACVPDTHRYDYIVASHFVEHTVDLVGFLDDCATLLKETGRLSLVIPDKRFSFDCFRPLTTVGEVVDSHYRGLAFHPVAALLDHQAYASERGPHRVWGPDEDAPVALQLPEIDGADRVIDAGRRQEEYHDIHRWVFTPSSFALLVEDLRRLGLQPLDIVDLTSLGGHEFFVTLGRSDTVENVPRLDRLHEIDRELLTGVLGIDADANPLTSTVHQLIGQARTLVEERDHARADAERLANALDDAHSSTSWRATAPLRALSRALGRRRPT